jgi:hypothetical protein
MQQYSVGLTGIARAHWGLPRFAHSASHKANVTRVCACWYLVLVLHGVLSTGLYVPGLLGEVKTLRYFQAFTQSFTYVCVLLDGMQ